MLMVREPKAGVAYEGKGHNTHCWSIHSFIHKISPGYLLSTSGAGSGAVHGGNTQSVGEADI